MDPDPSADREETILHPPPAGPVKRLVAAIALAALLASAAYSSWWIISGQADFTRTRPPAPSDAGATPEPAFPHDG
jgi:hypothetical protein